MISPASVVSTLWLVWLFGWLLASGWTARTVARQSPTSQLAYSVFIWLGAAILFFHLTLGGTLQANFIQSSPWIAWGGVALIVIGLGFAGWARLFLGQFWSGTVTLKEEHALVQTGPYALTRHPIYSGLLLALIGTALVKGTFESLIGLLLLMLGLILKIRQEEQLMIEHFGDAYRAYKVEVPGVVPRPRRRAA